MVRPKSKSGKKKRGKGQSKGAHVPTSRAPQEWAHTPETELAKAVMGAADMDAPEALVDFLSEAKNEEGFDINEKDSKGVTAIHFATWSGKLPLVKIILENGGDVNIQDKFGFTPLFGATGRYPSVEIAKYLLEEAGASVYKFTETGVSAIHGCALAGNHECLKLLLKHGADPRGEDNSGAKPLDLATDEKIKEILHKALRTECLKAEKSVGKCTWCEASPEDPKTLKRCSNCRAAVYCSKECQGKHWTEGHHKENCQGYIVAKPMADMGLPKAVMSFQKMSLRVYKEDELDKLVPDYLKKKQMLVKVQVAMQRPGAPVNPTDYMLVYNEDRSFNGFIAAQTEGYLKLRKFIEEKGIRGPMGGYKAYFWAETLDENEDCLKIFHGKMAPLQRW